MKNKYLFFLMIQLVLVLNPFSYLFCESEYSIVFIHIGKSIPAYVPVALSQARVFNPDCQIILVANNEALDNFAIGNSNITVITIESLKRTREHITFRKRTGFRSNCDDGFWLYTSERFLYLQDLMVQIGLKNVFHLENDNMLYVNLGELLPIFNKNYKGLAITMDNDERCIPGFVYISGVKVINKLAKFFADKAGERNTDMQILARFKTEFGDNIAKNLPIISEQYVRDQPMKSQKNHIASNPFKYCKNFNLFHSIFDAAAVGQYLGGIDGINGNLQVGFINESCVFNPSLLTYEWHKDSQGRRVPYGVYANEKFRINNLHIHSKDLWKFSSIDFQ